MIKTNEYILPKEKPFETACEINNEVPSFEEFMKSYENDGNLNYDDLSGGDVGEAKGYGPCTSSNCTHSRSELQEQLRGAERELEGLRSQLTRTNSWNIGVIQQNITFIEQRITIIVGKIGSLSPTFFLHFTPQYEDAGWFSTDFQPKHYIDSSMYEVDRDVFEAANRFLESIDAVHKRLGTGNIRATDIKLTSVEQARKLLSFFPRGNGMEVRGRHYSHHGATENWVIAKLEDAIEMWEKGISVNKKCTY